MKNIFIIIAIILSTNSCEIYAESIDNSIIRAIHSKRNTDLDGLMKGISNSTYIILPAIPIGLFTNSQFCGYEDKLYNSINIGTAVLISGATSFILKEIIKRQRPFETLNFAQNIGNESGLSMPSMHTATAFALATSITLIEPKWYFVVPAYMWATAVAYSRIHLGAHYLSDVIVGAIIGASASLATNAIIKSIK